MTETAKLTASDGKVGDALGFSVSIADNTAVAGAVYNDGFRGAAYVFVEPAGGWSSMTQTAKLSATGGDQVGYSVSVEGQLIVAGAPFAKPLSDGAAYVFIGPNAGWKNATKPSFILSIPFSYGYDYFGTSVSINGTEGIVGADRAPTSPPCKSLCQAGPGEAFVFQQK